MRVKREPRKWRIGPTKWSEGGYLQFAFYAVGDKPEKRIAIVLVDSKSRREGPLMTVTVNFPDALPDAQCVWIKEWSENEGITQALVNAKVGTLTGKIHPAGYSIAHELRLSDEAYSHACAEIGRQIAKYVLSTLPEEPRH